MPPDAPPWRAALALALLAALTPLGLYLHFRPSIGSDALAFILPLHNFITGHDYIHQGVRNAVASPGFALIEWPLNLLLRDPEHSVAAVSGIAFTLVVPLVFLAARPYSRGGAWIAALLLLTQPLFVSLSIAGLTEALFTLLLLAAFFLTWRALHTGLALRQHLLLGGLFGFGYLARPEMLPTALLSYGLLLLAHHRRSATRALIPPLAGLGIFLLLAAGYVSFLVWAHGHASFSGKELRMMEKVERTVDKAYSPAFTTHYAMSTLDYFLTLDREVLQRRIVRNLHREYAFLNRELTAPIHFAALALLAVGLIWALRRRIATLPEWRPWVASLPLIAFFCFPLPVYLFYMVSDRRLIPYILLLGVMILLFTARLLEHALAHPRAPLAAALLGVAVLAVDHGPRLQALAARPELDDSPRQAGLWLARSGLPPTRTAASHRHELILYYGLHQRTDLPPPVNLPVDIPLEQVAEEMRRRNVTYLLIPWQGLKYQQGLIPLWHRPELAPGAGLRSLHDGSRFKVFALAGRP
ncbi:MAG: glycosyltransferase family 39 protein [Magnetococcales bacterium]|nr:glycosyltransferase family 39 protein [Magnetococcales bacterium]